MNRYDGIYKVVKYYPEKGLSGFRVWKYLLRRDDPSPAPWESGAKQYPIIVSLSVFYILLTLKNIKLRFILTFCFNNLISICKVKE